MPRLTAGALAGALLLAAACASGPSELDTRFPVLRRHPGHRLADVRPYYLPLGDQLTLLLCRWPDGARIPVRLPGDLTPDERRKLGAALAAWQGAGLGVEFEVGAAGPLGIDIELVEGMLSWGANTVAECAVELEGAAGTRALPARMVYASIQLARGDPRLVGSALHELGHALGFQGHPRRGGSVMRRDADQLVRIGAEVQRGGAFRDATLAALYSLPSGTVWSRRPLPAGRTRVIDGLAERARRGGWRGPLLRVGDDAGRIAWVRADGSVAAVRLARLQGAREDAARLVVEAD